MYTNRITTWYISICHTLSSFLVVEPSKTRAFQIQTVIMWVPGMHLSSYNGHLSHNSPTNSPKKQPFPLECDHFSPDVGSISEHWASIPFSGANFVQNLRPLLARSVRDAETSISLGNRENRYIILVGGFNPIEHISQIESFPQVGVKINKYLKPPPSICVATYIQLMLYSKSSWISWIYPIHRSYVNGFKLVGFNFKISLIDSRFMSPSFGGGWCERWMRATVGWGR